MSPSSFLSQWESALQQILSRYPEPSKLFVSGKSPGTIRQNLQAALKLFVENPHLSTVLDHNTASLLYRSFVFASDPDGTVYVGPRRAKRSNSAVTLYNENAPPAISPIDCSNLVTLSSILHLKNFDLLPFPITITNFTPPPDLALNYPNIELVPNPDGSFSIL